MSASGATFTQLLVRLFACTLRFYPEKVRREYAEEMQAVFCLKAADAAQHSGRQLFRLACREARDLPLAIVSAHFHADGGDINVPFPTTSDRPTWPTALLSLLTLCAALAHLRIRSTFLRVTALLAGVFSGLFFWLLPIFRGMISAWIDIGMGLFLLLAYGSILTAILLAPMQVRRGIDFWRSSRAGQQ